jgi:hypothetical protein
MKYLSLLFLLGCAPNWSSYDTAYVWIDDPEHKFSSDQLELIESSLEEWETATDGHIHFEHVDGKGENNLIIFRPVVFEEINGETDTFARCVHKAWEEGCLILIPYDFKNIAPEGQINEKYGENYYFYLASLHELGHALGLKHENGLVVMNPSQPHAEFITCQDVKQFCTIHSCDPLELPPCLYLKKD